MKYKMLILIEKNIEYYAGQEVSKKVDRKRKHN